MRSMIGTAAVYAVCEEYEWQAIYVFAKRKSPPEKKFRVELAFQSNPSCPDHKFRNKGYQVLSIFIAIPPVLIYFFNKNQTTCCNFLNISPGYKPAHAKRVCQTEYVLLHLPERDFVLIHHQYVLQTRS